MGRNILKFCRNIRRNHKAAAFPIGSRLSHFQKRQRASGTQPKLQCVIVSGGLSQTHDIVIYLIVYKHFFDFFFISISS